MVIRIKRSIALALIAGGIAGRHHPELKPETVDAWHKYLDATEASVQAHLSAGKTFLWIDEEQGRKEKVRRGEIVVAPVVGDGTRSVPNGLIHHWIGGVFISNATLPSLRAVIDDHDNYKSIYKPLVVDSRSLGINAADKEFSMVWVRNVLFVRAAMLVRYRAREFVVDSRRGYSVVDATCIQEIEDYGRAAEQLLRADTGSGFIWRVHSTSRYEERDGGVYLEVEGIVLSRDIPPQSGGWRLRS